MIASEVVQDQAQVCDERLGRLGDKIQAVEKGLDTLTQTVAQSAKTQQDRFIDLTVAITKNNTRWMFPRVLLGISAALGSLAGIVSLIVTLFRQ